MLLDEVGGNMTQQLFEQMKRNYNIPIAEEVEAETVQKTVGATTVVEE
jgi:actin-like ATPase involved in cell morphogenesis